MLKNSTLSQEVRAKSGERIVQMLSNDPLIFFLAPQSDAHRGGAYTYPIYTSEGGKPNIQYMGVSKAFKSCDNAK